MSRWCRYPGWHGAGAEEVSPSDYAAWQWDCLDAATDPARERTPRRWLCRANELLAAGHHKELAKLAAETRQQLAKRRTTGEIAGSGFPGEVAL